MRVFCLMMMFLEHLSHVSGTISSELKLFVSHLSARFSVVTFPSRQDSGLFVVGSFASFLPSSRRKSASAAGHTVKAFDVDQFWAMFFENEAPPHDSVSGKFFVCKVFLWSVHALILWLRRMLRNSFSVSTMESSSHSVVVCRDWASESLRE